jgi:hypothetical protein
LSRLFECKIKAGASSFQVASAVFLKKKSNKFWGPVLICDLVAVSAVFLKRKAISSGDQYSFAI